MSTNTILLGIIATCAVITAAAPWIFRWFTLRKQAAFQRAEQETEAWLEREAEIIEIDQACPSCGSRHVILCLRSAFPFECTCKVCENEVTYSEGGVQSWKNG